MINKLRSILLVSAVLILVSFLAAWRISVNEASRAQICSAGGNLIRLHVIANSNDPDDQALKYRVRDQVIITMSDKFSNVHDVNQARKVVRENLGYIRQLAAKEVADSGKNYPVAVKTGAFMFPAKRYQGQMYDFTLPAGNYEALRINLGRGEGANWWCVLFPPLCFIDPGGVVQVKEKGASKTVEKKEFSAQNKGESPALKKAAPAFKLNVPESVPASGSLKQEKPAAGPSWTLASAGPEPPVEFRFKILDFLSRTILFK
ncbi:MAG: Stage II sporulation protein R [Desulfotomaculum sp. 46_296]|nr:MAG: Stage II sporulation protein R [Desulfotomaculum sp. 46_296]HAU31720.1 stage II sporulation protein R [Desulfotomaculum sp.]